MHDLTVPPFLCSPSSILGGDRHVLETKYELAVQYNGIPQITCRVRNHHVDFFDFQKKNTISSSKILIRSLAQLAEYVLYLHHIYTLPRTRYLTLSPQ